MSWKLEERLRARLRQESGYQTHSPGGRTRFALAYPNLYRVGMSNLGFHIIYDILNRRPDTSCERFFLPEKSELAEYERSRTPLLSLETQTPLADFSVIGFAVSFEMDYFHILSMLKAGRVKLLAAERGEFDPFVIAGGPCATFNPEPLALFFDAFIIGEGEETIQGFMEALHLAGSHGLSRREVLAALAAVPGVYVPSLYEPIYDEAGILRSIRHTGVPSCVRRQWVRNLDDYPAHTVIVTEDTEFDLYLIETARGCGRHCRFCMAGYCFRRPRNRSLTALRQEIPAAQEAGKRVGLMGAAISDYPGIDALCRDILSAGLTMSVASFRADSVTTVLMESLVKSGMKTLTLAPEAGSARMRAVINKGINEEHLEQAIDMGIVAGILRYRLYFMIGLPGEELADVEAIIAMAKRLKGRLEARGNKGTLTLSVNPFVPKPFTPFQWLPMASKEYLDAAVRRLRQGLKGCRGIEMLVEPLRGALVQGVLARGDRRIGQVLCEANENGGTKAFFRVMKRQGLSAEAYLSRLRSKDEVFPWEMLDMGVSREYLWAELEQARRGEATPACFDGCQRCGVCGSEE